MRVTVMYRNGWHIQPVTVEIDDKCPICGGPRGEPYNHRFYECGDWYSVDRWDNPCGHIDKYRDVLEEAQ